MIATLPLHLALGVAAGIAAAAILAVVLLDCRCWPLSRDPRGGGEQEDDTP